MSDVKPKNELPILNQEDMNLNLEKSDSHNTIFQPSSTFQRNYLKNSKSKNTENLNNNDDVELNDLEMKILNEMDNVEDYPEYIEGESCQINKLSVKMPTGFKSSKTTVSQDTPKTQSYKKANEMIEKLLEEVANDEENEENGDDDSEDYEDGVDLEENGKVDITHYIGRK